MLVNEESVSFQVFFITEFYSQLKKHVEENTEKNKIQAVLLNVIRFLNDQNDPLMKIELLAAVAGTSEITICISDLAERALSSDPQEMHTEIETQCQTTSELFFLTYEESPELLDVLADFLNQNLSNDAEEVSIPAPILSPEIKKIEPLLVKETIPEAKIEKVISEVSKPAEEVKKIDKSILEGDQFNFTDALIKTLEENLKQVDTNRIVLLKAIIKQIDQKAKILDQLIPSELSNIVIICGEFIKYVGRDFYYNFPILRQNLLGIDEKYLNELKQQNFNLIKAIKLEEEQSKSALAPVKKPSIQNEHKIDAQIKEKLKLYFRNEIFDILAECNLVLQSITVHNLSNTQFTQIKLFWHQVKDISVIHGYDGIELIGQELIKLWQEAIDDNLVFTEESVPISKKIILLTQDFFSAKSVNEEKEIVKNAIAQINLFNQSLAVVELINENLFKFNSEQVQEVFIKIKNKKIDQTINKKNLKSLFSDFVLNNDVIHAKLLDFCLTLTDESLSKSKTDLKMLLINSIEEADVLSFMDEYSDSKDIELNTSTNITEKLNKTIPSAPVAQTSMADSTNKQKHGDEFKNDKLISFIEFTDRFNLYESILKRKLDYLKEMFKKDETEKIIILTNSLEVELRYLHYESISDFLNFYSLNPDDYQNADGREQLFSEFDKIKESPSTYIFSLDTFNEEPEPEEVVDNSSTETSEEDVNWINSVADVLEKDNTLDLSHSKNSSADFSHIDDEMLAVYKDEAQGYLKVLKEKLELVCDNVADFESIREAANSARTLKSCSSMLKVSAVYEIALKIEKFFEFADINKMPLQEDKLEHIEKLIDHVVDLLEGKTINEVEEKITENVPEEEEDESPAIDATEFRELLEVFQEESSEQINELEANIGKLYSDDSENALYQIELTAQSMKLSAKTLGIKQIGIISESLENTVLVIKKDNISIKKEIVKAFELAVDTIKKLRLGEQVSVSDVDKLVAILAASLFAVEDQKDAVSHGNAIELDEFHQIFIEESKEILSNLNENLKNLIESPKDIKLFLAIEQNFFTIKSSASVLQMNPVKDFIDFIDLEIKKWKLPLSINQISKIELVLNGLLIYVNKIEKESKDDVSILKQLKLKFLENKDEQKVEASNVTSSVEEEKEIENKIDEKETNLLNITADLVQKRIDIADRLTQIKKVIDSFNKQEENKTPERIIVQKNINEMLQGFEELSESIQKMSKDVEHNVQAVSKHLQSIFKQSADNTEKYDVQIFKIADEFFAIPVSSIHEFIKLDLNSIKIKNNIKYFDYNTKEYQVIDLEERLGLQTLSVKSKPVNAVFVKDKLTQCIFVFGEKYNQETIEVTPLDSTKRIKSLIKSAGLDSKGHIVCMIDLELFSQNSVPKEIPRNNSNGTVTTKKLIENRKARILVADDSASVRKFIGDVLTSLNIETQIAGDGTEALNKLNKFSADLVIADLDMPNLSGIELVSNLKENISFKDIPLIILCNRNNLKDKDTALNKGADAFLFKPFKESELKQIISDYIEISTK